MKTYDSVRRELFYNAHRGLELVKLVRLIEMCLNETCSNVCIGKYLSNNFPIQSDLKQRDASSLLLFNFFRRVQGNLEGLKCNRTHQLLA
jgi:hypothetical protein